jgi:hypothetical protein
MIVSIGVRVLVFNTISTIFQLYQIMAVSFIGGGNGVPGENNQPAASHTINLFSP